MNLLLLLSALLSALTGMGVGVRRPEVAQSVSSQTVAPQPTQATAARFVTRPAAEAPTLFAVAAIVNAAMPVLFGAPDLWADRRRE